jgi:tetratricopeptide (TPR) repeat protein
LWGSLETSPHIIPAQNQFMLEFSPDQIQKALETVIASREFVRSGQLRQLLSYLVEAAIYGRTESLKEVVIGVELFHLPNFDPKSDPVVRMAMRRLRDRLRLYYLREGAGDPIVIALTPGNYLPRFVARHAAGTRRIGIILAPFEYTPANASSERQAHRLRIGICEKLGETASLEPILSESLTLQSEYISPAAASSSFLVKAACLVDTDQIRVCVELAAADGESTIWARVFEQEMEEVWTVQSKIAAHLEREVLTAIKDGKPRPRIAGTENGSYRLIVQGRHALAQNNRASIRKGEACFTAALKKQPDSAIAWAGLSVVQTLMAIYHIQPPGTSRRQAKISAERAINCDPSLAEAHTARGLVEVFDTFKPIEAQKYFRRALLLNPHDNSARLVNALACSVPLGRLEEAGQEVRSVLASDPPNARALQSLSVVLYFQRRYEESAEFAQSALDVLPGSAIALFTLANCYDRLGLESEAVAAFRKCEDVMPFLRIVRWPSILHAIYKGRTKWVRPSLLAAANLVQVSKNIPSASIADLLLRVGEADQALKWMQRAFRDRGLRALYLAVDPAFDSLRSRPECRQMLEELQSPALTETPA